MPKSIKKVIHVNQHNIKHNNSCALESQRKPVLTVKTYKANHKTNCVMVEGPSRIVYHPDDPLSCGARCWIETSAKVVLIDGGNRVVV